MSPTSIPQPEGRFLATTVNVGCKAAQTAGPLNRVVNERSVVYVESPHYALRTVTECGETAYVQGGNVDGLEL